MDLLDLKTNAASLVEAHSSAKEAQAATAQGRAVMLFTIITVIFVSIYSRSLPNIICDNAVQLPLSFFTSYFGQNVREITGDDKNHSTWDLWRVASTLFPDCDIYETDGPVQLLSLSWSSLQPY